MSSSSGDRAEEPDDPTGFGRWADSECVFCNISGKMTAELLYASTEWDYYYCYRCRGWFKRHFGERSVFLPVRSRTEVRRLTWIYTSRMKSLYEMEQLRNSMDGVRRLISGRSTGV